MSATPFWHEPPVLPAPGQKTANDVRVYLLDNVRLRLRLSDLETLDQEWHTHEGPWVPREVTGQPLPTDVVSISDAARRVEIHRETLYQAVRRGEVPRVANGVRVRVRMSDVEAWDRTRAKRGPR